MIEVVYEQIFDDVESDVEDEISVRGTRPLAEVYERCNMASLEPISYFVAAKSKVWRVAMKEELAMIEKNQTWNLVDKPQNKSNPS